MQEIVVKRGMSLLDVSLMYYGTIEMAIEIAQKNVLPLDYTFLREQTIKIPNYKEKLIWEINTGMEGESGWVWILEMGKWNDEGVFINDERWKDK